MGKTRTGADNARPPSPVRTSQKREKMAYERPKVTFREPLETVAALCTPVPPGKNFGNPVCFGAFDS